jgi:hypothetical protein
MGGNSRTVHAAGTGPSESCPGKVEPVHGEVARQVAIGDRHDVTTMAAGPDSSARPSPGRRCVT